jgi:predicted choloylglycine hydrolase
VAVATNHQRTDDWPEYAAAVASLERERRLEELAHRPRMTSHQLVHDFLEPPLYRRAYASGFGTLYTAAYYPALGRVEYHWPDHVVTQTFGRFVEQRHEVRYEVAG